MNVPCKKLLIVTFWGDKWGLWTGNWFACLAWKAFWGSNCCNWLRNWNWFEQISFIWCSTLASFSSLIATRKVTTKKGQFETKFSFIFGVNPLVQEVLSAILWKGLKFQLNVLVEEQTNTHQKGRNWTFALTSLIC